MYFVSYPIVFNRENFVELILPDEQTKTNSSDGEFLQRSSECLMVWRRSLPNMKGLLEGNTTIGRFGFGMIKDFLRITQSV